MSCCSTGLLVAEATAETRAIDEEIRLASRDVGGGLRQTDLSVPTVHCGGCIRTIERELARLPGVEHARVNLSTKRVTVRWHANGRVPALLETLKRAGFDAHLFDGESSRSDPVLSELIKAVAVSGFAASNIMLLSVSVWSGADAQSRDLFHLLSAFIAFPALVYSGRIFFRSAWRSLRHGRTNMDVPISIGVLLAFSLSLYETAARGQHAYFDAAISLLFFLLIGRTLDHMMRERARSAVTGLARLAARVARLVDDDDDGHTFIPVDEVRPGMLLLVATGDRVPVDATVRAGASDIDVSIVSGESAAQSVKVGSVVRAGSLNLTGPLTVVADASPRDSFLAEMVRLMEAAEQGRSRYRQIADRAAAMYAPVVHLTALITFVGWMFATGDLHHAVTVAIAVLIITCPCALGLAVPMVHVVASKRLFEAGVMVKDGGALERLAEIDAVLFDKTGTLTANDPWPVIRFGNPQALSIAATLASHSSHPHSRSIAQTIRSHDILSLEGIVEHPGLGIEACLGADRVRLGRPSWASHEHVPGASVVLSRAGQAIAAFEFSDRVRSGAKEAVTALKAEGLDVAIVSGDSSAPVRHMARLLGIAAAAELLPSDKVSRIADLSGAGRKVLMVGDGLNDAAALVAAHASMAPSSAADIGRQAADVVFLREDLAAVPLTVRVARRANRLVHENLMLAVIYNVIAVPIAVAGYVTPLVAAIAMSGSSILVVLNALRLVGVKGWTRPFPSSAQTAAVMEAE